MITSCQIRENIAIGDPAAGEDDHGVRQAASLAGAEALIEKLPDGFSTFLERPVQDHYSTLPSGKNASLGTQSEYETVRAAAGMKQAAMSSLSGGQLQRIAL